MNLDVWQPINSGRQQSSYREFTITLPANGIYKLDNPFNYFRCLESSHPFQVAWSTNQLDTDFEGGLGIKFDTILPYAQIFNNSNTPLVCRVGVGIGYFDDSRLVVSGTVQTQEAQYTTFSASTVTIASGQALIPVAAKTIIQNTGSNVMYIGGTGTDGLQLQPKGTFEFACEAQITVFGTDGDTIAIGEFN